MAIYIKQINKRRHLEKTLLAEALDRGAQRLGFLRKKNAIPQTSQSALRQLLEALGIKDYDLEENDIVSPEEQLTSILRPRGILMRRIRLTGEWWRECVGPLLGYAKDGQILALTPTSSGLGYHYRDRHGIIKTIGKKEMQQELKPTALTFTKPLPLRALNIKDLMPWNKMILTNF